jgi:hypothetical protein
MTRTSPSLAGRFQIRFRAQHPPIMTGYGSPLQTVGLQCGLQFAALDAALRQA